MLGKATFFMLEARHINGTRVITTACNSYPYYQDKKKLVSLVSKNKKERPNYVKYQRPKLFQKINKNIHNSNILFLNKFYFINYI